MYISLRKKYIKCFKIGSLGSVITRILLTSYPWLVSFSVTDESDTFWAALRYAFHPKPSRQMAVNSQALPDDLIGSSGSTLGCLHSMMLLSSTLPSSWCPKRGYSAGLAMCPLSTGQSEALQYIHVAAVNQQGEQVEPMKEGEPGWWSWKVWQQEESPGDGCCS